MVKLGEPSMPSIKDNKLYQALAQEMTKMLARNLRYAPAADELPIVVSVLTEDFMALGYRDEDIPRIVYAINQVGRAIDDWPTVNTIRKNIPQQSEFLFRTQPYKSLEQKPPTKEEKAKVAKIIAGMKLDVKKRKETSEKKYNEKERKVNERIKKYLETPYGTMPEDEM